ncbi:hypothetical protein niasHT_006181 [Heterodera trifolii]|uniref:Uncharacterized protein n=1 Tax=Heterodera trifolii TaxID=157864 RepID=A0ABD2M4I9_9BILA
MAHSACSNRMSARRRRASSSSATRRTMPTSPVHRQPRASQSSRSCANPRRCPRVGPQPTVTGPTPVPEHGEQQKLRHMVTTLLMIVMVQQLPNEPKQMQEAHALCHRTAQGVVSMSSGGDHQA